MFTMLKEEEKETKSQITGLTNSLCGTKKGKVSSQIQPNFIHQNIKIGSKNKHK